MNILYLSLMQTARLDSSCISCCIRLVNTEQALFLYHSRSSICRSISRAANVVKFGWAISSSCLTSFPLSLVSLTCHEKCRIVPAKESHPNLSLQYHFRYALPKALISLSSSSKQTRERTWDPRMSSTFIFLLNS